MKQMSLDTWSGRNELLNRLHADFQRRTHGRLSHVSLDIFDGALVIEARSATYYAVQLALSAVQAFTAKFPQLAPATMFVQVNGRFLVLNIPDVRAMEQVAADDDVYMSSPPFLPDRQPAEQSPAGLLSQSASAAT
jgi:hypothetical protein